MERQEGRKPRKLNLRQKQIVSFFMRKFHEIKLTKGLMKIYSYWQKKTQLCESSIKKK